jgi:tRNA pseudouridine38-40 synthase
MAARPGRIALGVAYRGAAYQGWQSQLSGNTVQDVLERALSTFADVPVATSCAGRTDAGVHAVQQVVHVDAPVLREPSSWVRGTNRYLPPDVAVQWCVPVDDGFDARRSALGRTYRYVCLESAVRPALATGLVGWVFHPLALEPMQRAAAALVGEHDFSSFRSSQCQALSPVRHLRRIEITKLGRHWVFELEANAFLHHMVRNLMGVLVAVGQARQTPAWAAQVLAARSREAAAPTFAAEGLYFLGPHYAAPYGIPPWGDASMPWLSEALT